MDKLWHKKSLWACPRKDYRTMQNAWQWKWFQLEGSSEQSYNLEWGFRPVRLFFQWCANLCPPGWAAKASLGNTCSSDTEAQHVPRAAFNPGIKTAHWLSSRIYSGISWEIKNVWQTEQAGPNDSLAIESTDKWHQMQYRCSVIHNTRFFIDSQLKKYFIIANMDFFSKPLMLFFNSVLYFPHRYHRMGLWPRGHG